MFVSLVLVEQSENLIRYPVVIAVKLFAVGLCSDTKNFQYLMIFVFDGSSTLLKHIHLWKSFTHKKLTEITIWGYFVSYTTIRVFDTFQCLQSENNYQKPVRKTFRLTLHNHCTLLIENRRFQIVMDPSQEPLNNFQAFLGMYPIDKIWVMVSVRDFCLFVFHCWFISFSNW